jgi:hypothetical protein
MPIWWPSRPWPSPRTRAAMPSPWWATTSAASWCRTPGGRTGAPRALPCCPTPTG